MVERCLTDNSPCLVDGPERTPFPATSLPMHLDAAVATDMRMLAMNFELPNGQANRGECGVIPKIDKTPPPLSG